MGVYSTPIARLEHVTPGGGTVPELLVPTGLTFVVKQLTVENGLASQLQHRLYAYEPQMEREMLLWRGAVTAGGTVVVTGMHASVRSGMVLRYKVEGANGAATSACNLYGYVLTGTTDAWYPTLATNE